MNITKLLPLSMAIVAILGISPPVGAAVALNPLLANKAQVVTPISGLVQPGDFAKKSRTHYKFFVPPGGFAPDSNAKINAHP